VDGDREHHRGDRRPAVRRSAPDRAALSTAGLSGQLAAALPLPGGREGLALSASRELEPDFRAALLRADGLFRLDVVVSGDTLRTVVRNLSPGELRMGDGSSAAEGMSVTFGDVARYEPRRAAVGFTLADGDDVVAVDVTIATLRVAERGTTRVTAQAIARPPAATP
jgi:hypothetical protein